MLRILIVLIRNVLVNVLLLLPNAVRVVLRARQKMELVRVELEGALPARRGPRPPWLLRAFAPRPPRITEEELDDVLSRITKDAGIRGLLLVLGDLKMGFGQLVSLRRQLVALRAAGKEVAVYFTQAGNGGYYLASAGSYVAMASAGGLHLTGFALETHFYRGLLDKVPADPEVIAAGRYKNAFDAFARYDMSEAHREANGALLDDFGDELQRAIAQRPGFDESRARAAVDDGPYTASRALAAGLVDAIAYEDELPERLVRPGSSAPAESSKTKGGDKAKKPEAKVASVGELLARTRSLWSWRPLLRPRVLAYIPIFGVIHSGESRRSPLGGASAGDETVCAALEAARKNKRVRGVVLHIDSRGGSGLASDLMWREVRRLREKKPVVAYMGDYAASGGYYVACGADLVLASPGTITGSIGVISAKISVGRLWERLGVHVEVQKRGERADMHSPSRRYTDAERAAQQRDILAFYDDFVAKVAECRKLPVAEIAPHAEGRVWTGQRALTHKLIDELGTLEDAIQHTKARAGFAKDHKVTLVTLGRPRQRGLGLLSGAAALDLAKTLPSLAAELDPLWELATCAGSGPLCLMPYWLALR